MADYNKLKGKYSYSYLTTDNTNKLWESSGAKYPGKLRTQEKASTSGIIDAFNIDWENSKIELLGYNVTSSGHLTYLIENNFVNEEMYDDAQKAIYGIFNSLNTSYVSKIGDIMTGNLEMHNSKIFLTNENGAVSSYIYISKINTGGSDNGNAKIVFTRDNTQANTTNGFTYLDVYHDTVEEIAFKSYVVDYVADYVSTHSSGGGGSTSNVTFTAITDITD